MVVYDFPKKLKTKEKNKGHRYVMSYAPIASVTVSVRTCQSCLVWTVLLKDWCGT